MPPLPLPRSLRLLIACLLVLGASVHGSHCSACRYLAYNCSDANAKDHASSLTPITKPTPVAVCDAQGQIQIDDVFCDGHDCACARGLHCVTLALGCQQLFQARNRRRCESDAGLQRRFEQCGGNGGALTAVPRVNLASDWMYFRAAAEQCTSADCRALRRFEACNVVQCGRLVVAWKEDDGRYHLVVDGARASDMQPGTFHYAGTLQGANACTEVTGTAIETCHSFQTRNQQNGTCDGVYLQADQSFSAYAQDMRMADLSWPVWLTVVGSVVGALGSVAAVAVMVVRSRRQNQLDEQMEDEGLLDPSPSNNDGEIHVNENEDGNENENENEGGTTVADLSLRQRGGLFRL